eukprot:gb/GEZN01005365.1/.p1 GENE.gb/GEZN01005365.1/~~gb/GEZN01005365.1/.p1  ORF type:complete len:436 (-),score=36.14 gb/GEZN01005365.1/:425-1732(-)
MPVASISQIQAIFRQNASGNTARDFDRQVTKLKALFAKCPPPRQVMQLEIYMMFKEFAPQLALAGMGPNTRMVPADPSLTFPLLTYMTDEAYKYRGPRDASAWKDWDYVAWVSEGKARLDLKSHEGFSPVDLLLINALATQQRLESANKRGTREAADVNLNLAANNDRDVSELEVEVKNVWAMLKGLVKYGYRSIRSKSVKGDKTYMVALGHNQFTSRPLWKKYEKLCAKTSVSVPVLEKCCSQCHVVTNTMLCSVCRGPRYCSKECQKQHWKQGHKLECKAQQWVSFVPELAMPQHMPDRRCWIDQGPLTTVMAQSPEQEKPLLWNPPGKDEKSTFVVRILAPVDPMCFLPDSSQHPDVGILFVYDKNRVHLNAYVCGSSEKPGYKQLLGLIRANKAGAGGGMYARARVSSTGGLDLLATDELSDRGWHETISV